MKNVVLQAQEAYQKLPGEISCPAFSKNIQITRAGYNHLIKDKERTKKEIEKRISCLPSLVLILRSSYFLQDHQYKYTKSGRIDFFTIQAIINQKIIRVVIRKIGAQPSHLYSVVFKGRAPRRK